MIHVIVNPSGAGGAAAQTWVRVRDILKKERIAHKVHFSAKELDIDNITLKICGTFRKQISGEVGSLPAVRAEDDLTLLVIGGDGTMNLAVNGIENFGRVRLGFIPCGSGNDLARSVGISKDAETELKKILEGNVKRELDIGRVTYFDRFDPEDRPVSQEPYSRLFNISSGIGFDASICYDVSVTKVKDLLNKIRMGKLCYLTAAFHTVFAAPRTKAEIRLDDRTISCEELLLAACMNEPYEGGGFRFGPEADATDGILDLCVGDGIRTGDFFRIFPTAYKGSHVRFDGVDVYKAREIEVKTEKPMWVHTDGEIEYKSTHVTFSLCAEKLKMLN